MDLSELFESLSYGELSNLSLSDNGSGEIIEAAQPKVVRYINEALLRLHSRFVIKENYINLKQYASLNKYPLLMRYAEQSYDPLTEDIPFIQDNDKEKYKEDLIKIISLFDHCGCEIPLNDEGKCNSFFTPEYNVLQIPNPIEGNLIDIVYQAKHAKIDLELETNTIEIPDVLFGALGAYISFLAYKNINTQEALLVAQTNLTLYESICLDITDRDLLNNTISRANKRFILNGWK